MAMLEALERWFPGYATAPQADWDRVKESHPVGTRVSGRVVHSEHFGVFADIGVGFPALLLIVRVADNQPGALPEPGSAVEGTICVHADADRQLAITQKPREPWMEGDW